MATSPDGVLTAEFDPGRNLVSLLVDGWPAPGVLRTNLCPNPRYIGDDGLTGSGGGTWTQADVATGGPDGRGYTEFIVGEDQTTDIQVGTDERIPVTPGKTYTGSLYAQVSRGGVEMFARLFWRTPDGGSLALVDGPSQVEAGGFDRFSVTGVAPAGAAFAQILLVAPVSGALLTVGNWLRVGMRMIEQGDTLSPYHDGDTPDTATLRYDWTGAANESPSTESWTLPTPDTITITRSSAGASSIGVRGAERLLAPGGTALWSDNEAPQDADVTYTVEGFRGTMPVGTSTVTVSTAGAVWGVWVKAPGRPELTTSAPAVSFGDFERVTLGGSWQVPGGPTLSQSGSGALAQSAGMGALTTVVVLQTRDMGRLGALERTVRQAPGQVILLQTGQPEDLPSGYYQVKGMVRQNPGNVRPDQSSLRRVVLTIEEAVIPAGPASGWAGTTYNDVLDEFPTYQDLADAGLTYLDVARGAWS